MKQDSTVGQQPQAVTFETLESYVRARAQELIQEVLEAKVTELRRRGYQDAGRLLEDDWERMVTFFRFPREHWGHLRTTNPVESPFAALP